LPSPKNYNDDKDARQVDPRLRGPIRPIELQVDPETGMKNYIANTRGDWATSAAFVKYSFERCIHHGRLYTNGHGIFKGKDDDLAEALRCLGQGLHCLEDFGAHTNYVELALRELGMNNVFPHTGTATAINLRGKHTFPLVTGTFGMVDFFHSVLGEATDHFTQSEINEMDNALGSAQSSQSSSPLNTFTNVLSKIPGTRDLCVEAEKLQASSQAQAQATRQSSGTRGVDDFDQQRGWHDPNAGYQQGYNQQQQWNQQPRQPQWGHQQQPSQWDQNQHQPPWNQPPPHQNQWDQQQHQPQWNQQQHSQPPFNNQQAPPPSAASQQGPPGPGLPGMPNFDPAKTIQQIYPILVFRDKVVRSISAIISKIPGLEALVDKITETLTIFILSLLAPFIRPIINGLTKQLQAGSSAVVDSSGRHQYEPWTDPHCTDPTHSMLSKDHFSNVLNEPAGLVASETLKFVAPRVLYAWDHPNIPVQQVLDDCMKVFHHPATRDRNCEVHRNMFDVVQKWANRRPGGERELNDILSSEGVRAGRNHKEKPGETSGGHSHGAPPQQHHSIAGMSSGFPSHGGQQHPQHHQGSSGGGGGGGGSFNPLSQLSHVPGMSGVSSTINKFSSFVPGGLGSSHGGRRGLDGDDDAGPGFQSRGFEPETAASGNASSNVEGSSISRGQSPYPPAGYEGYSSGSQHGGGGGEYQQEGAYDAYGNQQPGAGAGAGAGAGSGYVGAGTGGGYQPEGGYDAYNQQQQQSGYQDQYQDQPQPQFQAGEANQYYGGHGLGQCPRRGGE
jgi:Heterokaryon incompatibility protein Het-C